MYSRLAFYVYVLHCVKRIILVNCTVMAGYKDAFFEYMVLILRTSLVVSVPGILSLNNVLSMLYWNSFVSCFVSPLGFSTGEFQAL